MLWRMQDLKELNLSCCCCLTDTGLERIAQSLSGLARLDLSGCTEVTDQGVTNLSALTGLHVLSLSDCSKVTDVCIMMLAGALASLTHLIPPRPANL
jgi:Leucine Rich repeat